MTDPPIVCGVDGTWHHGIETVTRAGDAATELTEAARERKASLPVRGSRGRGSLRVALLGSVSAAATRLAPCAVVIVPSEASITRSDERADLASP
jgi:nucleotide-binding universal stress UspA family protein